MKSLPRTVVRVSVLESDPVRFLGLRAIFASQHDIQIHTGTVASVLAGPENEMGVDDREPRSGILFCDVSP